MFPCQSCCCCSVTCAAPDPCCACRCSPSSSLSPCRHLRKLVAEPFSSCSWQALYSMFMPVLFGGVATFLGVVLMINAKYASPCSRPACSIDHFFLAACMPRCFLLRVRSAALYVLLRLGSPLARTQSTLIGRALCAHWSPCFVFAVQVPVLPPVLLRHVRADHRHRLRTRPGTSAAHIQILAPPRPCMPICPRIVCASCSLCRRVCVRSVLIRSICDCPSFLRCCCPWCCRSSARPRSHKAARPRTTSSRSRPRRTRPDRSPCRSSPHATPSRDRLRLRQHPQASNEQCV